MPLTNLFSKGYSKAILMITGAGSAGYGLWLINPFNPAQTSSVIKLALSAGSLEILVGLFSIGAALWFMAAIYKENIKHIRKSSMTMTILWLFFCIIYLTTNAYLAVVPLSVMFAVLFAYVFVKSPKIDKPDE